MGASPNQVLDNRHIGRRVKLQADKKGNWRLILATPFLNMVLFPQENMKFLRKTDPGAAESYTPACIPT